RGRRSSGDSRMLPPGSPRSLRRPLSEAQWVAGARWYGACIVHVQTTSKEESMPGKKSVKGVGAKEERMYEHIKESAKESGRYGKRAEEVAARTVMKHHKEESHKKGK